MDYDVTKLEATVLESRAGLVPLATANAKALYTDKSEPVELTKGDSIALYTDKSYPVELTKFQGYALFSLNQRPALVQVKPVVQDRELNPYRPTLPDEIESISPLLYDHMKSQVETIREQHNVTQAGDSTFGWELLTKIGPEQQFTLGSLGRFYHDDFGIILARYCQFALCAETNWFTQPVGYLRSDSVVTWRVTNDWGKSDPSLVAGVMGSFRQPENGWFGWVITQGANHAPMLVTNGAESEAGDGLVWSEFERMGPGRGRVLGRGRTNPTVANKYETRFEAGQFFIDLEGPSIESLRALLGDSFKDLEDQIKAIQKVLDDLGADTLIDNLNQLLRVVEGQSADIRQLQGLAADLNGIKRRLNALEGLGDSLYLRIMGEVGERLDAIIARLDALPGGDYAGTIQQIQDTLTALAESVSELEDRASRTLIPLVDGSIPPNLVYLPSGELVLVEFKA